MTTLIYSMAGLVIGAVAADLDRYFKTAAFFYVAVGGGALIGLWQILQ